MSDPETEESASETQTAETTPAEPSEAPPRPERRATLRFRQRELSRLTLAVGLIIAAALCFGGYRVYRNFKSQRDITIAKTNLHELYKAMRIYAEDRGGKLPTAGDWTDKVTGYLSAPPNTPGGPESYLHGPGDGEDVGYVYNDLASDYNLEPIGEEQARKTIAPNRLVVLIEQPGAARNAHRPIPPLGTPQSDDALSKILTFPHYADDPKNATTILLMADGSEITMIRQDLKK